MKPPAEVYVCMQEALIQKARSLRSKRSEQRKVAAAHNRYLDLDDEIDSLSHRMHCALGLFGPDRVAHTANADGTHCLRDALQGLRTPENARERLTLWRAVREYLRVVREAELVKFRNF